MDTSAIPYKSSLISMQNPQAAFEIGAECSRVAVEEQFYLTQIKAALIPLATYSPSRYRFVRDAECKHCKAVTQPAGILSWDLMKMIPPRQGSAFVPDAVNQI